MEKIRKFLSRIRKAERDKIESVIKKITLGNFVNLDFKKLKGHEDVFRVRIGVIRIIFRRDKKESRILEISRRNNSTYKNL